MWADVIVLQSPVFWFGTPWTYKKYADEVLMAGLMQQKLLPVFS
jgi:modulator of drug activity B